MERSPDTKYFSFFHCFMYNRRHLGCLNLKAIVLNCKNFLRFDWVTHFWPDMTHIRNWPWYCQDKHSDQVYQNRVTNVASRVKTRLSKDLTWWPSFYIKHDPFSNLAQILLRQAFWARFIKIWSQLWSLECKHEFTQIWPGDLPFDPTWPIFDFGLDTYKTNILTKFHQNQVKNVASIV